MTTNFGSLISRLGSDKSPRSDAAALSRVAELKAAAVKSNVDAADIACLDNAEVVTLLAGIDAGSPYLRMLVNRDPALVLSLLRDDPDVRLHNIVLQLQALAEACPTNAAGFRQLMSEARRLKCEAALLIAFADLGGVWTVDAVMQALTRVADCAVQTGIRYLFRAAAARGAWLSTDETSPEADSGFIVLAMGKHGAHELNYSSDIDLIVLFDRDKARVREGVEPQQLFVRITRDLVRYMQERTSDGYIFRTDLRLRPDPGATQVAMSTNAALSYYESVGQNWERAAMIKARVIAGDFEAGQSFLDELGPFIWRKYLDFAAIADIHAMKRQIHAYRGFGAIAVTGHNLKLGRGGIREIEFFAQTQQLIAGGRQPELRVRQTCAVLDRLLERGWIESHVRYELQAAYGKLRWVEHRLQMVADEQTQTLPRDPEALTRFARFCGFDTVEAFEAHLREILETVQSHYAALFEDVPELTKDGQNLVFAGNQDDPDTLAALSRLGFAEPSRAIEIVGNWHRGRYRATRSAAVRERLTVIQPHLVTALADTIDPDAALLAFDRLLAQLPAGVQFFAVLRANPALLRLIATIVGSAPRLAEVLGRRRRVLDAVLDPQLISDALPSRDELTALLDQALAGSEDLQTSLDRVRILGSEQSFLIGVRILAGMISAAEAGLAYARLAEAIIAKLHAVVVDDFVIRNGRIAGGESVVIAMGKLGGGEMTAASDLDLILIYDAPADAVPTGGDRPLTVPEYFGRLTQRLITALSAPTAEGQLYDVDMRLRPSGQKGPLAVRFASFETYQKSDAWTWEHMALTRARVVAGDPSLAKRVEAAIGAVLTSPRDRESLARDVREMRARVAKEKGTDNIWDLKQVRGGLVDLEFTAQFLQLAHAARTPEVLHQSTLQALSNLDGAGHIGDRGPDLIEAGRLLHELTQILRLCFDGPFEPERAPDGLKRVICDIANLPTFAHVETHLKDVQATIAAAFDHFVQSQAE
ncbi:MAG: bifunctional [glutamine synthetase] adenylyltransferase/[glutamine synthetase]-adenylyl-L-tyrosine phosphorylase [Pseudomonadota bacterium]